MLLWELNMFISAMWIWNTRQMASFFHVVILPPSEPVKNDSEMWMFSILGTF